MTHPDGVAEQLIQAAADDAYRYAADYRGVDPNMVYRLRECRVVAMSMQVDLMEKGIPVEPVARGGEKIDEHRYLKWGGEIIDATWQQFIPETDADLPKVYVGSREGLQQMAAEHGAEPWAVRLWDEQGMPPAMTVQERIARAYDEAQPE